MVPLGPGAPSPAPPRWVKTGGGGPLRGSLAPGEDHNIVQRSPILQQHWLDGLRSKFLESRHSKNVDHQIIIDTRRATTRSVPLERVGGGSPATYTNPYKRVKMKVPVFRNGQFNFRNFSKNKFLSPPKIKFFIFSKFFSSIFLKKEKI